MVKSLPARGEESIVYNFNEIYERRFGMIYRVCFSYMKNAADTEDITADVFAKLLAKKIVFRDTEYEKAWLLRTAINMCKDHLKHWRRKNESLDGHGSSESADPFSGSVVLESILALPERYRDVIYLYYYEGYAAEEIAGILKRPHSTIRGHLREARNLLKGVLENEE